MPGRRTGAAVDTGTEGGNAAPATGAVEAAASWPRAGEARTPERSIAMTNFFTPRQYTKSKNSKHLYI
jgi:hypothetical protein